MSKTLWRDASALIKRAEISSFDKRGIAFPLLTPNGGIVICACSAVCISLLFHFACKVTKKIVTMQIKFRFCVNFYLFILFFALQFLHFLHFLRHSRFQTKSDYSLRNNRFHFIVFLNATSFSEGLSFLLTSVSALLCLHLLPVVVVQVQYLDFSTSPAPQYCYPHARV